jgi:hypothetical protein
MEGNYTSFFTRFSLKGLNLIEFMSVVVFIPMGEISFNAGFSKKENINFIVNDFVQDCVSLFHIAEIECINYRDFQWECLSVLDVDL